MKKRCLSTWIPDGHYRPQPRENSAFFREQPYKAALSMSLGALEYKLIPVPSLLLFNH